jgi:16S rRNA (guanine527-N7)-methyltransferase
VIRALERLEAGAEAVLGRTLEPSELEMFDKYLTLLEKWQRVHRMVGSSRPMWIVENLFLDSLLFLRVLPVGVDAVVDIGSGAGFPGIPIKIVSAGLSMTLLESRERRLSFLSTLVRELRLRATHVIGGRAEHPPTEMLGSYGAAVMRCAGAVADLVPAARRLVRPGGLVVCAGPPAPRPIEGADWVEVEGMNPGSARRFAVFRA